MIWTILVGLGILIVAVLLFGFTIFIHELGHFLVARACGMVVDVFSIGFGHAIWKKEINGVTYKIGWIPLGGYVALPQMEPASEERRRKEAEGTGEAPVDLPPVEPWKKICVAVAGAVGNIIFAIVLAWVIYFSGSAVTGEGGTRIGLVEEESQAYEMGVRAGDEIVSVDGRRVRSWYEYRVETLLTAGQDKSVDLVLASAGQSERTVTLATERDELGSEIVPGIDESSMCRISSVLEGKPADLAGLRQGDDVISVNGKPVASTGHFINIVSGSEGQPLDLMIEREGEQMELAMVPYAGEIRGETRWLVGVQIEPLVTRIPPWMRHKDPWKQIQYDASSIKRILQALTTPSEAKAAAKGMGGPVSILSMLWLAVQMGIMSALGFIRFLNINLAILNLMPIPILDGGHIVFALYEAVTRRRIPARVVHTLVNVFFVLLLLVFVTLTIKDVKMLGTWFKKPDAEQAAPAVEPAPVPEAAPAAAE